MIYQIGLVFSCIITGYVFFEIMCALYEKKYSKWIYLMSLFIYTILSILVTSIKLPILNVLYSTLIFCVFSCLLYNTHGKNVIINSVIVVTYLSIIDLIVTVVFSAFTTNSTYIALKNPEFFLVSGVGDALLMLCTSNLLIQLITHHQIANATKYLNLYMIFLAIFEFSIIYYFLQMNIGKGHNIPLLIISLGFMAVDAGVLYLFKTITQNTVLEKQTELLKQQHNVMVKYCESMQESYGKTQQMLHDVKKHMRVISDIKKDGPDLRREYIEELIESINGMQLQFHCSNKIVCAIMLDKIRICEKKNITLDISMQDVEFEFMDKIEVTTLFANLLDNAIEACQRSKKRKKEIHIRIHQFKDYIVIKMQNTIEDTLVSDKGNLKSSKPGHHGLGMVILDNLANKYCGNLNYEYTDKFFETKIILLANNST